MRRFTTPTQRLIVNSKVLLGTKVFVTYQQGFKTMTIEEPEMNELEDGVEILVPMTQLETAGFLVGPVRVQVNWIDSEGIRLATTIASFNMKENLLTKEVSYESEL